MGKLDKRKLYVGIIALVVTAAGVFGAVMWERERAPALVFVADGKPNKVVEAAIEPLPQEPPKPVEQTKPVEQPKPIEQPVQAIESVSPPRDSRVNINTAGKDALMSINGIGSVIADNIIAYREKSGGFKNIEEIKNVARIGEKTFEKIKDFITAE